MNMKTVMQKGIGIFLITLLAGCGGGGSSSSDTAETQVDITLRVPATSGSALSKMAPTALKISRITLSVTGVGMEPISTTVPVGSGQEDIADITVHSGLNRVFVAKAYDAVGLAFYGTTTVNLEGTRADVYIFMRHVPRITGLSLVEGLEGDMIKITGIGFGEIQGNGFLTIGGEDTVTQFARALGRVVERWSDTEIIAQIPPGIGLGIADIIIEQEGLRSNQEQAVSTVSIVDTIYGIGGEDESGDLDRFALTATSTTLTNLVGTDSGESASVALSADGDVAIEADQVAGKQSDRVTGFKSATGVSGPLAIVAQDVAVSQGGEVALFANGTAFLQKITQLSGAIPGGTESISGPGDCLLQVAVAADGNTAAAIGQSPCGSGEFHLFRIDDVLSTPTFTRLSSSGAGVAYTDVALSADATTAIVGRINAAGVSVLKRVLNFNSSPKQVDDPTTTPIPQPGCPLVPPIKVVDVDISADGMTAVVMIVDSSDTSYHFRVLDVDLDTVNPPDDFFTSACGIPNMGAVNAGGALFISKPFTAGGVLQRVGSFNIVNPAGLSASPVGFVGLNVGASRFQDQLDLQ